MYYVYILTLENSQHYVGCTEDLRARLKKHAHRAVPTTSRIRPEELTFYAAFKSKEKAYAFEKYLKSSSGFAIIMQSSDSLSSANLLANSSGSRYSSKTFLSAPP